MYERRLEPNGVRLALSIHASSIIELDRMNWRPFNGVGLAIFTPLSVKPEGGR
jgi:hypothetical protein